VLLGRATTAVVAAALLLLLLLAEGSADRVGSGSGNWANTWETDLEKAKQ